MNDGQMTDSTDYLATSDAATVNANGEMVAFDPAAVDTTFKSAGKRSAKLRA